MMTQRFVLRSDLIRRNAVEAIMSAPEGYSVTITEKKRSQIQSDKMWAMLGDVAKAKPEGRQWTPETWKCAFLHSLGHQIAFAEGLDGSGPFPIGFRSSHLNVRQMSDLIEVIYEYGTRHGVKWTETESAGYGDFLERVE